MRGWVSAGFWRRWGELAGDEVGGGVHGRVWGYVELSYCCQGACAGIAGWVVLMTPPRRESQCS